MSLVVWLPLTKDLRQQGLSNVTIINNGATYSSTGGKLGGCYIFDGVDDAITVGNLSTLVTDNFSFACWFYHDDTWSSKNYETIFGGPSGFELEAKSGSTNSPVIRAYSWGQGTFTYELNKWNHLVMTRTTSETKFYLNGELKLTGTAGTIPSGNYFVGSWSSTTGQNFKGKVNDVRIYDHCLSPMEVKELAKGLVLHYPLNRQGWGQENLLSRYVVPGQAGPTSTSAGGRTTWLGDYKITIPATENADTYFRLFTTKQLTANATYTISCQVSGLKEGSSYNFPLYAQNNTGMGILQLNHNGLCSLTFTMTYGTQTAATGANGETVYICFMDDSGRSLASGQGAITVSNFKLEEGSKITPWCPNSSDTLATTMDLNSLIEYDCSGFNNNSRYNSKPTISSDTPKYNVSTYFGEYNTPKTDLIDNSLLPALTNCTITWWEKNDTTRTLLLTGQSTSHYIAASDNNTYYHGTVNGTKTLYRDGVAGTYKCEAGVWHHYALVGVDISAWTALHLNSYGSYWYLKGLVSDLRIYATALSADDVKSLYQNSAYIDSSGNVYGAVHSEV